MTVALVVMFLVVAMPALAQDEVSSRVEGITEAAQALDEVEAAEAAGTALKIAEALKIEPGANAWIFFGGAFGAAMIIFSAAYGISKIGTAAVESMARQPEVAGNIQTAMIIAAALVEGVTFFGLIVCLLAVVM
jgi:F-type H+-transporting ATPase subunit c